MHDNGIDGLGVARGAGGGVELHANDAPAPTKRGEYETLCHAKKSGQQSGICNLNICLAHVRRAVKRRRRIRSGLSSVFRCFPGSKRLSFAPIP
eukprot:5944305-Prymnesium_polylepis.1